MLRWSLLGMIPGCIYRSRAARVWVTSFWLSIPLVVGCQNWNISIHCCSPALPDQGVVLPVNFFSWPPPAHRLTCREPRLPVVSP